MAVESSWRMPPSGKSSPARTCAQSWQPPGIRAVWVPFTIFVLLVVLGGCGGEPSGPPPGGSQIGLERFEVNRQPAVLITPAASTRKVVVYVHGAGETVENIFRDQAKEQIFKTLLQAGYALAASDAHGDSWGNTASERDYLALISALRKRGLRDVYVLALSMGGFNGLQLLGHVPIKAWAGIFPACDLDSVYDLGLYARDIRTAHGLDAGEPAEVATRGRSPVAVNPPPGLPMRFWASPGDRVIPKRRNTDACAALARRRGARVEVTTTQGDHGDPSNFDAAGILRLFDSAQP